ncbi:MAG: FAD-binding oxidoreductase [Bacteroidetes bacterium]|nr:MAG: FAD-binding oxidoreductase [Bacteroidota bacterium]
MDWSYWERNTFLQPCDVLIVGGGITGLSAAIALLEADPRLRVTVLERGFLPLGASTRNAGFACFGSMTELLDDMARMGEQAAWQLVARRWEGLQLLRRRLGDEVIRFRPTGGYELFRDDDAQAYASCLEKMDAFNEAMRDISGMPVTWSVADDAIPRFGLGQVRHLIRTEGEGMIDTGRMMDALIRLARERGARLLFGLGAEGWQQRDDGGVAVSTSAGCVLHAAHLVVTTNGFARRLLPELAVLPARNQVLVTPPLDEVPFDGTFHYLKGYVYFRNVDGRVLLGGGRHLDIEGETTDAFGTTERIRSFLLDILRQVVLPGKEVAPEYWWSGIMGVGEEKAPIIRTVAPHVHVAVRLGGMGVAIGSLVGQEVAELVLEQMA